MIDTVFISDFNKICSGNEDIEIYNLKEYLFYDLVRVGTSSIGYVFKLTASGRFLLSALENGLEKALLDHIKISKKVSEVWVKKNTKHFPWMLLEAEKLMNTLETHKNIKTDYEKYRIFKWI